MIDDAFAPITSETSDPLGLGSLLKPSEVANALRIGTSTVDRMIERGELPVVKVGSIRRIPIDALKPLIRRA